MGYKILKNKTFHIPTERIKQAEKDIKKEDELICKINAMTDQEYKEYVQEELEKVEIENSYFTEDEFWKELNKDMASWQAEVKNYENWRKILEISRKENISRYIK